MSFLRPSSGSPRRLRSGELAVTHFFFVRIVPVCIPKSERDGPRVVEGLLAADFLDPKFRSGQDVLAARQKFGSV